MLWKISDHFRSTDLELVGSGISPDCKLLRNDRLAQFWKLRRFFQTLDRVGATMVQG